MHLLASREYPVIDYQTMAEFVGHERLFRTTNGGFLLHLSSAGKPYEEERIIRLIPGYRRGPEPAPYLNNNICSLQWLDRRRGGSRGGDGRPRALSR
jgi:hypothetical protein